MGMVLWIPFIGTSLGAAMVFFLKERISARLEKALLGFAAGVMIAASVWSLLIPSIEMSGDGEGGGWIPAVVGYLAGIGFLLLLDELIPHLHKDSDRPEGLPVKLPKTTMMLFAVTLHNIPEGMAVGISLAGALAGSGSLSMAGALALSWGIAIQNFPEGAIVSLPLKGEGMGKRKAFLCGVASGAVEPAAGLVTVILAGRITIFMPYLLAFAAGAMFYVVVEELIPSCQSGAHSNIGTVGSAFGFALMMALDVAFG